MENVYNKVFALKLAWGTVPVIFLFIDIACIHVLPPQVKYEVFEGRDYIFYFYAYLTGSCRLTSQKLAKLNEDTDEKNSNCEWGIEKLMGEEQVVLCQKENKEQNYPTYRKPGELSDKGIKAQGMQVRAENHGGLST